MEDKFAKKENQKEPSNRKEYLRKVRVKSVDSELFAWAESQRQSLSEVIALALRDY